jgi:CDP-glucose 4,6-dehydratase
MRILLTGHNGFKGTWFTVLLRSLGHEVEGLSLPSEDNHLSRRLGLERMLMAENFGDIKEKEFVKSVIKAKAFDFVVHFAAQSLVRESYRRPEWTVETNVNGTLNILDSVRQFRPETPILVITTDKVYRNDGRTIGYVETDPLGGEDPYSTSKAMADLLTQSWQSVFPNLRIAIARAGNVIGGGDTCKERLMPDLVKAYSRHNAPQLRNPDAIRPWQHVLDCLNGYYQIMSALKMDSKSIGAWNIGPDRSNVKTVRNVAEHVARGFEVDLKWENVVNDGLREAQVLLLDSSKANQELNWHDKLSFEESIDWTVRWERGILRGVTPLEAVERDIAEFMSI